MNTNTMELNLNEMEQVNGGSLYESLMRICESASRGAEGGTWTEPLSVCIGGAYGFCKGVYHEIAGEGFAA